MLSGYLLENKVGIKIMADTSDLVSLHETVRKITLVIVDYELQDTDASNLLIDFLEKIERAYIGNAVIEKRSIKNHNIYYGFVSSWIELLLVDSLLRSLSDYVAVDEIDEVNMRLMEYITRKAILLVNEKDPEVVYSYVGKRFACKNIKQFISGFNCDVNRFQSIENQVSFKKIGEYLTPYFENCL